MYGYLLFLISINLTVNIFLLLRAISFAIAFSSFIYSDEGFANFVISDVKGMDIIGRGSANHLTTFTHRSLLLVLDKILDRFATISISLPWICFTDPFFPPLSIAVTASINAFNRSPTSIPTDLS
ncbi:MAG: hypothetical protein LM582_04665 [Desulfurococcaceae archaeon]|nr:hypothetical protein [Desulfurococcaceae archaeon]